MNLFKSRSHRQAGGAGAGVLLLVALLEIAIGVFLFFWWRAGICQPPLPASIQHALLGGGGAGPGGGDENGGPNQEQNVRTQSQAIATSAPSGADSASTGATAQDAAGNTSGSLRDVPDPKCVGKTTASLLGSGSSTPPPSCAPMKAPPQLQQAAAQVQNMNGATNDHRQPAASPTP